MSEVAPSVRVSRLFLGHGSQVRVLFERRNWAMLTMSAFTFSVTWMIAAALGVPAQSGFDGSLLAQQGVLPGLLGVVAAAASIVVNVAVLRYLLSRVVALEILFAVGVGLLAFSARGGSMVDLLQYHGGGVYVLLIFETLLLYAALAAAWLWLRPKPTPEQYDEPGSDLQSKLTALAVTAVVMIVMMHLLCQTPSKKQAIFSVAITAFLGATVAFSFLGEMSIEPYVLAPLVVAVVGYVMAIAEGASPLGQPTQVLAFPLPLHYAGAGVAGALLGYWTGLGWKQENEAE